MRACRRRRSGEPDLLLLPGCRQRQTSVPRRQRVAGGIARADEAHVTRRTGPGRPARPNASSSSPAKATGIGAAGRLVISARYRADSLLSKSSSISLFWGPTCTARAVPAAVVGSCFRIQRQGDDGRRLARHAVDGAALDGPGALVAVGEIPAARVARHRPSEETRPRVEPVVGLELRILVEGARSHGGAAAHEQVGVAHFAAGLREHVDQRAGEQAVPGRFLRQLPAFARRQQDVTGRRHEQRLSGVAEARVVPIQVALERALGGDLVRQTRLQPANGA